MTEKAEKSQKRSLLRFATLSAQLELLEVEASDDEEESDDDSDDDDEDISDTK